MICIEDVLPETLTYSENVLRQKLEKLDDTSY